MHVYDENKYLVMWPTLCTPKRNGSGEQGPEIGCLWIKSAKGHLENASEVKYKDGDRGKFFVHAETTDKALLFATNGRFYTISCNKLQGGRGFGEPVRLIVDLGNEHEIVNLFLKSSKILSLSGTRSIRNGKPTSMAFSNKARKSG